MKKLLSVVLVTLLTGCTSLSMFQAAAVNMVIERVHIPERQMNGSLTEDEQVDEGEELSDTPTL